MTPEAFRERVEAENRTALSRLGSSKSLYAETGGEMAVEPVLHAAADAEHHAAETYRAWADSSDDPAVAEVWAAVAEEERDHHERVTAELEAAHEPGEPPAIQRVLREEEGVVARAGGFLGRTLAADRSKDQFTGFFVGQAEPQLAALFRELAADLEGQADRALALLAEHCTDEADWERAGAAAGRAIQAAYEEYTETLEGMGVNPKPVC